LPSSAETLDTDEHGLSVIVAVAVLVLVVASVLAQLAFRVPADPVDSDPIYPYGSSCGTE
jgi:hypothetical protein